MGGERYFYIGGEIWGRRGRLERWRGRQVGKGRGDVLVSMVVACGELDGGWVASRHVEKWRWWVGGRQGQEVCRG